MAWWMTRMGLGLALLAANGCYRSVTVESGEAKQIRIGNRSAHIVYRNGDSRYVDSFDTVTIRERFRGWEREDSRSGVHVYGSELNAELHGEDLRVTTGDAQRTFAVQHIEGITLERDAPARPWIITGAAMAGAVLGGFIGWHAVGCSREDPSGPENCIGAAAGAVLGMPLGLGVGLAISIPASGNLGSTTTLRSSE